ncbi:formimidoylglutamate deiminase [Streptomyces sodiiphilus]|uniref:formimidoylglutamate deiminase n=1 Tax=Streptomyces sodiiphilus TaxID=226217 RepID=UPI003CD0709F
MTAQTYWAEYALLDRPPEGPGPAGRAVEPGVVVTTGPDGTITALRTRVPGPPVGAVSLRGLTVPGLANAHSHAFHRALRGAGEVHLHRPGPGGSGPAAGGSFWSWRDTMYEVAGHLDPDTYFSLARAVYAEMALAGITCAGEFHYLHHAPGGSRYADPNAMGEALAAAAAEAGIRLTLLDTCYLTSGFGTGPTVPQLRFSDGTADAWAERAGALRDGPRLRTGAAVHSVRAVPAEALSTVAHWARERGAPLHVHLSEQPAENDACREAHGRTPTRLLADHGVLGPGTTAVHATHLTGEDIALLGESGTGVCLCPTTERDLADGIGPAGRLRQAGVALSLGSDSHAVIDLLEEARAVEMHERLTTGRRGHFTATELLAAASGNGHAALGWPEAGRLETGAAADFTTVALDTVRTAGPPAALAAETVVFAAGAADIRDTVVAGRHIVRDGTHQLVPDVPGALAAAVAAVRGR